VRDAERQVNEELNRLAAANRVDYERALANENSINQSLDRLKQNALDTNMAFVKLRELEREVEASRAVYESFLNRARETREQERLDSTNVRILSDAQAPRDRNWPPRLLILLLAGLIVGVLGGCGLAYAAEQLKRTTLRPGEHAALAKHAVR
jgi:polysaccharide biosynthesis transport protein